MIITFDGRFLMNPKSGLGRYSQCILLELIKNNNYESLVIILDSNNSYDLSFIDNISYINIEFVYVDAPLFSLLKSYNIARFVNEMRPDIYFYPHFNLVKGIKVRTVFVVHDSYSKKINFSESDGSFVGRFFFKFYRLRFLKSIYFKWKINSAIKLKNVSCVCVSNSTKNDISEFIQKKYMNKISVVYEAGFTYLEGESGAEFEVNFRYKNYFLYVGDRRPHKNIKKMIDIFNQINVHGGYTFLIAGSSQVHNFDYEHYVVRKKCKDVVFLGAVSDSELVALYKNTLALFFLSKHEGFGLPLLEAAKYGAKVITSNTSCLPEFSPPGSLLLSPDIGNDVAVSNILDYMTLPDKSYIGFLNKFSWHKTMLSIFY